jgi:ribonuclease D
VISVGNDEAQIDEARMTNDEGNPNAQMTKQRSEGVRRHSDFVIRHSAAKPKPSESRILPRNVIAKAAQLGGVVRQIQAVDRVAIDTEADSLHCYREKLCLLQISLPAVAGINDTGFWQHDYIVDPLADIDLTPLSDALGPKEIVLHGADYDLRLLRRALNFIASRIFDTVLAARLLGIREFGLAALVKRYFGVELGKGSQKANWGRRPLSARMIEYAINDTHYLLPLAECLESELRKCDRLDWLRQSCRRAIEQAAVERMRDDDELWRIRGSAALSGCAAAVLRALWQWREREAEAADRPPFHVLQNHELLNAAVRFASGGVPDYKHFSSRRRYAFRKAATSALELPESEWPVSRRRRPGSRPSVQTLHRAEALRQRRDKLAKELGLEPSFVAPRSAIEAIAADRTRAEKLLVPWQRELLSV